jgi:hypothetical protein
MYNENSQEISWLKAKVPPMVLFKFTFTVRITSMTDTIKKTKFIDRYIQYLRQWLMVNG